MTALKRNFTTEKTDSARVWAGEHLLDEGARRRPIGIFEQVVGRLQPILAEMPRAIGDAVLAGRGAAGGVAARLRVPRASVGRALPSSRNRARLSVWSTSTRMVS